MKKIVGIIPARYNSTRLPGKPLIDINGKPMIQHVYERTQKASFLSSVYVATDDNRIRDCVEGFGGKVIMTSPKHESGTDRLAEAAESIRADIIVNIQGDEPLIEPEMINSAIKPFLDDKKIYMGTLIKKIDNSEDLFNPSIAKVVIDKNDFAVYFSRSLIPYPRDIKEITVDGIKKSKILKNTTFYKHIGLYVYTKKFLLEITKIPLGTLEKIEKLEQLRVLENGFKIKTVETTFETLGVDTIHELKTVKKIMLKNKNP